MPLPPLRTKPGRRALLGLASFLLTHFGSAPEGRATRSLEATPPRHVEARQEDGRWCVHAGAPVAAPPVVDGRGRVYVATTGGHVHSFTRQGSYRWSFTLSGAVAGPMALAPDDEVLWIGTTDRRVLSLGTMGRLRWALTTVAPVLTGLAHDGRGALLFGAGDRHVYSVSTQGGVRWRVALRTFANDTPTAGSQGVTWVTAGNELLRLQGAWRVHRVALPEPAMGGPLRVEGGVAVVAGSRLLVFDEMGEERWSRGDVAVVSAAPERSLVVVSPEGTLTWLDGDGKERAEGTLLGAPPTARPALSQGVAYVPLSSGELWGAHPEEGVVARWVVSRAPLKEVTVDPGGGRAIVAIAGGRICSVPLVE